MGDIPLTIRQHLWFVHDRAPAHSSRGLQTFSNGTFQHWIGRGSHIAWPARSRDLSSLDFFCGEILCAYLITFVTALYYGS